MGDAAFGVTTTGVGMRNGAMRLVVPGALAVLVAVTLPATGADAAARATSTVKVHGRVLTSDGLPVAGVQVYGWSDPALGGPPSEGRTDSEGRFSVLRYSEGPGAVIVLGTPTGPSAAQLPNSNLFWGWPEGLAGDPAAEKVLRFPEVSSWQVRTLADDGTPAVAARVTGLAVGPPQAIVDPNDDGLGGVRYDWNVPADDAGVATVRGWTGLMPTIATVTRPWGSGCVLSQQLDGLTPSAPATVTLRSNGFSPVAVPGRLVTSTGAPAGGATVTSTTTTTVLAADPAKVPSSAVTATCTDSTITRMTPVSDSPVGSFTLLRAAKPQGRAAVTVTPGPGTTGRSWVPDTARWAVKVAATVTYTGPTTFRLPATTTTRITVASPNSSRVAGANVSVSVGESGDGVGSDPAGVGRQQSSLRWTLRTDATGRASFRAWPHGLSYGGWLSIAAAATLPGGTARARLGGGVPSRDAAVTLTLGAPGRAPRVWGGPRQPARVSAVRIPGGIRLTWTAGRATELPLVGYRILYAGNPGADLVTLPVGSRSHTFRTSERNTYCVFTLAANPTFYYDISDRVRSSADSTCVTA